VGLGGELEHGLRAGEALVRLPGIDQEAARRGEGPHDPGLEVHDDLVGDHDGHARGVPRHEVGQAGRGEPVAEEDLGAARSHRVVAAHHEVEQAPGSGRGVAVGAQPLDREFHGALDRDVVRDDEVGGAVEPLTLGAPAGQLRDVGRGRARDLVGREAGGEHVVGRIQPDHGPGMPQPPPRDRVDDRAAAGGENGVGPGRRRARDPRLGSPEGGLAVLRDEAVRAESVGGGELLVEVEEVAAGGAGEEAAHG